MASLTIRPTDGRKIICQYVGAIRNFVMYMNCRNFCLIKLSPLRVDGSSMKTEPYLPGLWDWASVGMASLTIRPTDRAENFCQYGVAIRNFVIYMNFRNFF